MNYDFIKLTTLDPQKEVLLQSLEVEAAKLWSFSCNSWVFFLANLSDIFHILLLRKFLLQRHSTLGTVVPLTIFLGGDGVNLGVNRAAQAFKKPLGNKKEERLQGWEFQVLVIYTNG